MNAKILTHIQHQPRPRQREEIAANRPRPAVAPPRAVLLAGGQGSRLRPYRTIVPKPLLPIGNRSILDLGLRQLARHGISDITLAVGELAPLVGAIVGDGSRHGVHIRYSAEHEPLGTAGVLGLLELDDPFLLVNGNVLTTLDFEAFFEAHRASGNAITVATHRREVVADFGVLELDGPGATPGLSRISDYYEKPATTYTVSMGIYAMQPLVRSYLQPGEHLGLPDLLRRLLADGQPVGAFAHEGLWLDMRHRADYEEALEREEELAALFGDAVDAGDALVPDALSA